MCTVEGSGQTASGVQLPLLAAAVGSTEARTALARLGWGSGGLSHGFVTWEMTPIYSRLKGNMLIKSDQSKFVSGFWWILRFPHGEKLWSLPLWGLLAFGWFFWPLKFTGKTKALAILLGLVWLLNAWAMPHGCRVDRNDLWVEDKDCIPCKCHMPYDITLYHVINHQSLLSYYLNQTTHTHIYIFVITHTHTYIYIYMYNISLLNHTTSYYIIHCSMHCIILSPSIHAGCHGGPYWTIGQKAEVCRLGPLGSGLGVGASNHVPQARLGA